MAIDDNTSYELTGYQVKDLAGRIRLKADASAIPTVNDATLTLVQNGTTVGTFTANQSTNTTVNLAGGVYADDPTAPANPNAWITSGDIDWTTMPGSYSTTEQKTPFTWIDGKPIYKKTINFGALPNATNKSVAHGISNLDRIVKVEQSITNGSQNSHGFIFISSNSSGSLFNFYGTETSVAITTTDNRSDSNAIITLWYTKTTD